MWRLKTQSPKPESERKAKTDLDRRSFRDGAIYLFTRADYGGFPLFKLKCLEP